MEFRDQELTGDVRLDGHQFYGCTFRDARLLYSGTIGRDMLRITNCKFEGKIGLHFDGPAAQTIGLLQLLYRSGNRPIKDLVKDVLATITRPLS